MSNQASQFERDSDTGEILRERDHTLDLALGSTLAAIEAQIGPEFDAYAAELEQVQRDSELSQNQPATTDIQGLRERIDLLGRQHV
jgi:hypothetical protein